METVETTIEISAPPQTVWSVLDDLQRYHEWNPVIPRLEGLTTVGQVLDGELVIPNMPTPPLTPTITRIVALRELRWLSVIPGDSGFTAEHIFVLTPSAAGTRLLHREIFEGPAAPHLAEPLQALVRPAYLRLDQALKKRAESLACAEVYLHPASTPRAPDDDEHGGPITLRCLCEIDPVEVVIDGAISHNHLCGCSKCWKPAGALFAQTAVVAADLTRVTTGEAKLAVVDETQAIKRRACKLCGAHMLGHVANPLHHFYGIDFIHPELSRRPVVGAPEFAGFVSSIIEAGMNASLMASVHSELAKARIPAYDAFSPEIMDVIAYHKRKVAQSPHG